MKCDLLASQEWPHLCDLVKEQLGLGAVKAQVKLYKGLSHALYEVTHGLASRVPHKQAFAYIDHVSPYFEPLTLAFLRLGYKTHTAPANQLEQLDSWLTPLIKDCAFFLFNEDDPITGRLYNTEAIAKVCHEQRFYRVSVSHSKHLRTLHQKEPGPYEIHLLSYAPDLCVAIVGSHSVYADLITPQLHWDAKQTLHEFESLHRELGENEQKVKQFEAQAVAELRPLFPEGTARLYDRAVVYWPDIDGWSALTWLAEKLKLHCARPGVSGPIETTSLCRWNTLSGLEWFDAQGWSEEVVRGLLLIDQSLLNDETCKALVDVRRELLELQNG